AKKPDAQTASEEPVEAEEAKEAKEAQEAKSEGEEAKEAEKGPAAALQKEFDELQEHIKQSKHELLLSLADFENHKKRFVKEREDRRRSAMAHFTTKMIQVYGKFDSFAAEKHDKGTAEALHQGVALTRDLYKASFERFGVQPIKVEIGDPFVVARHIKAGTVERADLPTNSVAEVLQPGWILDPDSPKPVVLQKTEVRVAEHGPPAP
ncbi:unnamed protein product, partial [Effrenium voratum]